MADNNAMAQRLRTDDDVPRFHEDLMTEILAELPVKSLCSFKCVCKKWLAETLKPTFITKHLNSNNNKERLLLRMLKPGAEPETHIFGLFTDDTLSDYQEPQNLPQLNTANELFGPCNGIFLTVHKWEMGREMGLLNPATQQFKMIPFPEFKAPHHVYYEEFGFGTDPSSCCHFKVILFRHFINVTNYTELPPNMLDYDSDDEEKPPYYPLQVAIYSTRTDSWNYTVDQELMNAEWSIIQSLCNTCVGGVNYWVTAYEHDSTLAGILTLDMETERFTHDVISVPESAKLARFYLAMCLDSIALITYEVCTSIDVWLLKDGCWSKKFNITPFDGFNVKKPVGVWKNDGIVFLDHERQLIWYNLVTKKFKILGKKEKKDHLNTVGPATFAYKETILRL